MHLPALSHLMLFPHVRWRQTAISLNLSLETFYPYSIQGDPTVKDTVKDTATVTANTAKEMGTDRDHCFTREIMDLWGTV